MHTVWYNDNAINRILLCFVWRIKMKYEMPTCEIVKLDVADILTASGDIVSGDSAVVPAEY